MCLLHVRRYVVLGAAITLALLMLLMLLIAAYNLLCGRKRKVGLPDGSRPLLSYS